MDNTALALHSLPSEVNVGREAEMEQLYRNPDINTGVLKVEVLNFIGGVVDTYKAEIDTLESRSNY